MFDTDRVDPRFHPKEWIIGVEIDGVGKAYPFAELKKGPSPVADQVGGRRITVRFNPHAQSASVADDNGKPVPSVTAFWFAWYAFHPKTLVFTAPVPER
jgi:hypothetical protein